MDACHHNEIIIAGGHVLWDGDGWQITADGRNFLRALEAVTQDNRPAQAGPCAPEDGEGARRPPAELIVVGHRFKSRRHHVPALPERPRSRAKPDAAG